jgi:diaminohydroxyphosphoribosylaminopyrimidine deaminase/5-amino-6-(5-phosphoribosylamino)uracil reductase
MVGCVIAQGEDVIGEGWHKAYGDKHAEINALQDAGDQDLSGATVYVSLEPCSHQGKTPPCTDAIIQSGAKRVVVAIQDPFPQVSGQGINKLRQAGLHVDVGVAEDSALDLNAPYLKLLQKRRPWVLAKWASTLDGKIATQHRASQWISSEASRAIVHQIRGRVDAIVIGVGTAIDDDPLLIARPAGHRIAMRIVIDSKARLPLRNRLVKTATKTPLLVSVGPEAHPDAVRNLESSGVEIFRGEKATHVDRLHDLLDELGRRRMTNILVEGGSQVLGGFLDAREIDEVHAFIAPKLIGGGDAITAIAGTGVGSIPDAVELRNLQVEQISDDIYVQGRTIK